MWFLKNLKKSRKDTRIGMADWLKKIDTHCYTVEWSSNKKRYAAIVMGFPYLKTYGDTPESALLEIRRKVAELEMSLEEGNNADTPTESEGDQ